jgi:hypothetical protein
VLSAVRIHQTSFCHCFLSYVSAFLKKDLGPDDKPQSRTLYSRANLLLYRNYMLEWFAKYLKHMWCKIQEQYKENRRILRFIKLKSIIDIAKSTTDIDTTIQFVPTTSENALVNTRNSVCCCCYTLTGAEEKDFVLTYYPLLVSESNASNKFFRCYGVCWNYRAHLYWWQKICVNMKEHSIFRYSFREWHSSRTTEPQTC